MDRERKEKKKEGDEGEEEGRKEGEKEGNIWLGGKLTSHLRKFTVVHWFSWFTFALRQKPGSDDVWGSHPPPLSLRLREHPIV